MFIVTHVWGVAQADMTKVPGKQIVYLLANAGHVAQETLRSAWYLKHQGCDITFLAMYGGTVRLDPLCDILSGLELLWDPTLRLRLRARREHLLQDLPSIAELALHHGAGEWLDGFDAVVVPGGHGRVFGGFVQDQRIIDAVAHMYWTGRAVGLICHAPVVGAMSSAYGPPIVRGRTVTCWPRAYESVLGGLPVLGPYFMPAGRLVGTIVKEAGASVHDAIGPGRRIHALADGRLVTGSGPWSVKEFVIALLKTLSEAPSQAVEAGGGG